MREKKENKLPTWKEEERENKKLLKRERRNKTPKKKKKKTLSILLITSIKRQRLSIGLKELLSIFYFKRHKKL